MSNKNEHELEKKNKTKSLDKSKKNEDKINPIESGSISVHTENLFPIIKKWLYSEHDIFLRELISNAFDAIKKLDHLCDLGECKIDLKLPLIKIDIDKSKKIIIISDNGLGMTIDEIKKYINQIAFSGAEEFLNKYENKDGKDSGIIGHFGLGFFSSFMVSDKVEIDTLSYLENANPVKWSCSGSTLFEISKSNKKEVGTDIILHINSENEKYLEESKLKDLVKKYSNFLPIEIQINGKKENESNALWQKNPNDIKEKDYLDFYKKLFPYESDPLFHVHLNIEYPFKLKGILYFPKIRNDLDIKTKGRIKLFCNNVFVSDNIPDIIPQYLNLLQGVLDSPDIPLNVSRSFLQVDSNVKKIVKHIVKKIVDKLKEIKKENPDKYQEYWEDIHPFVEFGMMNDQDFYEKAKEIVIYKKVGGGYATLDEYKKDNIKLKNKIIYTSNLEQQSHLVKQIEKEGIGILILDSPIDTHFLQQLEMKVMPTRFLRVDSDIPDNLIKDDEKDSKEDKDKEDAEIKKNEKFLNHFKKVIGKEKLEIKLNDFKEKEIPCVLVLNEHMRRFNDMSSMMNKNNSTTGKFDYSTLVLNTNNLIIKKIDELFKKDKEGYQFKELSEYILYLALIQHQKLEGDDLNNFIKKTSELLQLKFIKTN